MIKPHTHTHTVVGPFSRFFLFCFVLILKGVLNEDV